MAAEDRWNPGRRRRRACWMADSTSPPPPSSTVSGPGLRLRIVSRSTGSAPTTSMILFEAGGTLPAPSPCRILTASSSQVIADIGADRIFGGGLNIDSRSTPRFFNKVNDAAASDRLIVSLTQPSAVDPLQASGSTTGGLVGSASGTARTVGDHPATSGRRFHRRRACGQRHGVSPRHGRHRPAAGIRLDHGWTRRLGERYRPGCRHHPAQASSGLDDGWAGRFSVRYRATQ